MNPNQTSLKVVIVEDNVALNDIYKTRLEILGYECHAAYDGEQALAVIERELPNLVLLDLMVPKIAGDQILARMRATSWGKSIKVLIISNLNEADAPAGLRAHGIEGYAVKANLSNDDLDTLVDDILKPTGQEESVDLEQTSQNEVEISEETTAPIGGASSPQPHDVMPGTQRITTFLTFSSRGKEAVDLYVNTFKNSTIHNIMVTPDTSQLLHAAFSLDGQEFMAMDAGPTFKFEDGISLFVTCDTQDEVDYYSEKLTANGGSQGRCGWLKDPYGVSWQIIPTALGRLMSSPDAAQSVRVMQAMMGMDKLDIAGLEAAASAA
jgi:predicted 3-demethylubiquinone-9 3-methyltransferase (glyoxalase superfamily)/ActR/RegA family two-component response regulator